MERRRAARVAAAVVAVVLSATAIGPAAQACEHPPAAQETVGAPTPQSAYEPKTERLDPAPVVTAVQSAVPGARVGAVVVDLETNRVLLSTGADLPLHSASLVKLLIAIAAANEAGDDPAHAARVERMLRDSDDDAASALWGLLGGDTLPSSTAADLGIGGVTDPDVPGRWGNTLMTPNSVAAVLAHLVAEAPEAIALLAQAPRLAADGFDQHFGIPSAFTDWAVKQGWGNGRGYTAVHSAGVVDGRHAVVVMAEFDAGVSPDTGAAAVTAGARALAGLLA
ncbi:D-alanyl-D-alanine carboxypeptidase [Actinokineospora pegani]|uniref:D-alanyl-D-alanine carboxypeptidase n=1 Tax=Actinokineospora pegani TaxID=2654637 RepID=UPI0012EA40DE|nr:D-alanyl-D-alanine carboxypeptidase [Actinokineospora pegani]